jgi:ADP-heptose:LPS heptosyltransferase
LRPRALVLRAIGLGDFLTGVPALRALRRALPGHELVLAAPEALRPLVGLTGAVDRLLPTPELAPIPWTGPPPDVAVDLHGNGPASRRLLEAVTPGRLVAYAGPRADGSVVPGPAWDVEEHETRRWCRLVASAFPVEPDPDDLLLAAPETSPLVRAAVVVHPGAAYPSRRWPEDRFAAVARWAAASGGPVVLTGSRSERAAVQRVRRLAGLPRESVLAGSTGLGELAALVADARLVVSGDTGAAHLASAFRTPSVVLFGPVPPHRWGPPAAGPHAVLWHGTGDGDPRGDRLDPALARISVDEVVDRAAVMLGQSLGPRVGRRSTSRSG